MEIFILDKLNNTQDEISLKKPKNYKDFSKLLEEKVQLEHYEIFIIGQNNKEIMIDNEDTYKLTGDIFFIREIDKNILKQSIFEKNYNKLSESKQEILDEKYSCNICLVIIKKEKPYLCYNCQKIFHQKCLKDWDKKLQLKKEKLRY